MVATVLSYIVDFVIGFCTHAAFDVFKARKKRRALRLKYAHLSGAYSNWRNGTEETGGTIQLEQQKDGSFKVTARREDDAIEWAGKIDMMLDENAGTGRYSYFSGIDFGFQLVTYIPEENVLHVTGENTSALTRTRFIHHWRPLANNQANTERSAERVRRYNGNVNSDPNPWTKAVIIQLIFDFLLMAATTTYAVFAIKQWQALRLGNEQTKIALHVSERAYLTINPMFDIDKGVVTLTLNNGGRIPSGQSDVVIHEATVNQMNTSAPADVGHAIERHWKRARFDSAPPGNVFSITIPIPKFSKPEIEKGTQSITVVGRVNYGDGFPDDPQQQWSFCYQSVRQVVLNQTFVIPFPNCQSAIAVMEHLDGYPNNEQNN
jgi:hypothetical protein